MTAFDATREFAQSLDESDPLRGFRDQFNFPDDRGGRRNVYVCGNSLGLQPKIAVQYVTEVLTDWARLGVEGHFHASRPWLEYHRLASGGFATLTGAHEQEVVAMNTLTVNLHVLMATFYRPDAERNKIVIESHAFPSDYFAVTSQLQLHGYDPADSLIEWEPREDELLYNEDLQAILDRHGDEIALLLLPGVQYYTGQVLDMAAICELGRRHGCRVGLDLAHAVGNVALELHEWAPDFASWCTYKYLNAGPGAVAGAFVHERHDESTRDRRLAGWWGHRPETRFAMDENWDFVARRGADGWQVSNPPILALAPVRASVALFARLGMPQLRSRSLRLTGLLEAGIDQLRDDRIEILTPRDPDRRGAQLSLRFRGDVDRFFAGLAARGIVGDLRRPDVIRLAPAPIYNTHVDVWHAIEALQSTLAEVRD